MSNLYPNNSNQIDLRLSLCEFWDFTLSKEVDPSFILDGSNFYDDNIISYIDINNNMCVSGDTLFSIINYNWDNCVNNGVSLYNYGFNGIDNGFIVFDKNNISPEDFATLVTGSTLYPTLTIPSGDTRLILRAVSGNTGDYIYPLEITGDTINDFPITYTKLNGGFYQGFFKSENYSILPDTIEKEISFDFILKPDLISFDQPGTLNYKYANNRGLFFYLGVRAENKFWYKYSKDDVEQYDISKTGQTSPLSVFVPSGDTEFIGGITLTTNNGFSIESQNVYNIPTDNKYLLFNRTERGQVVSSFDNTIDYHITGVTKENVNYYPYVNRTKTGYTSYSIDEIPVFSNPYEIIEDISRNAIGFRITDDGRIGYRVINEVCETGLTEDNYVLDNGYVVIDEEYSESNIIWDNEITFISIRMILNNATACGNGNRTFNLWFYVKGVLVFVSKDLPELLFRKLNDMNEKQEGIAYNISLGGGTQGLCDMIGFDEDYSINYLFPIEKYFAGTFIGNIYKFRVNYGKMDYSKIKNNYDYEFYKSFNGTYVRPSITFWLDAINVNAPETTYSRETGNVNTKINASIKLNNPYCTITSYKLYYYRNDSSGSELIGEFNNMAPYGGDITYTFIGDSGLNEAGLTNLKFSIEVLDTCNSGSTGTIKDKNINFNNMIFYGSIDEQPTTPTFVRVETMNELFSNETYDLLLRTGARNKIFIIAVPENREVTLIVDQSSAYTDITSAFEFSTMDIEDAGGRLTPYNVYTMTNAIPYNKNHNLAVSIS